MLYLSLLFKNHSCNKSLSLLITKAPLGFNPSRISSFAFKIFSRLPRLPIWAVPTLAGKLFKDEKTPHPTQKPEALIMELIKAFCPKNSDGFYEGTILDPFHGSGTLGVCCEKLNKQGHKIHWVGIELEEKWCDIAKERLDRI